METLDSDENEVEEIELEEDPGTEDSRKDSEALLAESRRQELALLEAERKASARMARAQSKLAKWEQRLEKAERRVTKWQRRLAEAEANLRASQEARAIGPAVGWQSPTPVPIPVQEPTSEESAPVPAAAEEDVTEDSGASESLVAENAEMTQPPQPPEDIVTK